jgi:hypothetical protein
MMISNTASLAFMPMTIGVALYFRRLAAARGEEPVEGA